MIMLALQYEHSRRREKQQKKIKVSLDKRNSLCYNEFTLKGGGDDMIRVNEKFIVSGMLSGYKSRDET